MQWCPDGLSRLLYIGRKHLAEIEHHRSDARDDSAPTELLQNADLKVCANDMIYAMVHEHGEASNASRVSAKHT